LNSTNPKCWRTPFRRENVVMINVNIRKSLKRTGRGGTMVGSKIKDSNPFHPIISRKVHSWFSQEKCESTKFLVLEWKQSN
jgi:hypothetical protein